MTLATRCPSCETIFRMTTQEATARGGTVRCGVCGTAFNALDALVNPEALRAVTPATPPEPSAAESTAAISDADTESLGSVNAEALTDPPEPATDALTSTPDQVTLPAEDPDHDDLVIEIAEFESQPESQNLIQDPIQTDAPGGTVSDAASDVVSSPTFTLTPEPTFEPVSLDATEANTQPATEPDTDPNPTPIESPAVSTTDALLLSPRARTYEPSGKPGRRTLFVSLCVLAVLALAAQALYVWRESIAAQWPSTRPLLIRACALLRCRVELPMDINALSIESSELQAIPQTTNSYGFNTLLRNRSGRPLRYPALELTLTDALDQLVLRRVLLPEQYLSPMQRRQIDNGIAANAELPVRITFNAAGPAVVGYRVGIFYP